MGLLKEMETLRSQKIINFELKKVFKMPILCQLYQLNSNYGKRQF